MFHTSFLESNFENMEISTSWIASSPESLEGPPKPKKKSTSRYRVCGTPSRFGCITCKIRRVKCGEEKPFCKRCTSTGRKCDGYGPRDPPNPPPRSPVQSLTPPSYPELDQVESNLLYFFTNFTAPSFSGDFSSEFWERRVLQASYTEPSIRHAAIAIGAIHQEFCNRPQTGNPACDPSTQAFAFRQYTKAISHLHNLMSTQSQHLDATLIACILFISFDCLLGNHASAIIHLKAGLKLLEDIQTQSALGLPSATSWEREFAPRLLSIGVHVAVFVNPTNAKERASLWLSLKKAGLKHPDLFDSLDEAKHALNTMIANIMFDRTRANTTLLYTAPRCPENQDDLHSQKLDTWAVNLDRYLSNMDANEPLMSRTIRAASMLKAHSLVMSIIARDGSNADEKFAGIVTHIDFLLHDDQNSVSSPAHFSLGFGVLGPLIFLALKCPNLGIRQKAIQLISLRRRREGLWDSEDSLRIAEAALAEERSLAKEPGDWKPSLDVKVWLDMIGRSKNRMTYPFGGSLENEEGGGKDLHSQPTSAA